jgi:hypothetical protein
MTHPRLWTAVLLIATCGAPAALAGTITTYDIDFTAAAGGTPAPTAGSFTYDSTTPFFSDFTVTWDGIPFTLTDSANDPSMSGTVPCLGSLTGAAASFALLSGACNPPDAGFQTSWSVNPNPTTLLPVFLFSSTNLGSDGITISDDTELAYPAGSYLIPNGGWTITPVPEPNSVLLPATLFCACAFLVRKRIEKGLRSR